MFLKLKNKYKKGRKNMEQEKRNLEIASIINSQLPNKWQFMTGSRNMFAIENGLQFKLGKNPKKISIVQIILNGDDLYNLKFYTGIKNCKLKKEINGIYNDMLRNILEEETKLYFSLFN
jgi:hypothetical protein